LASSRLGTAIGLRALNAEWGAEFFEVPIEATIDQAAADRVFSGPETVIDVQTHLLAPHSQAKSAHYDAYYEKVMPDWWRELRPGIKRDLAWYLEAIFIETENAVAVLTSGPGTDPAVRALFNDEMYAVRALVDGLAGSGRLYNHAVVHAQDPREIAGMRGYRDEFDPIGWKVYTPGRSLLREDQYGRSQTWVDGWMLDDHEHGFPFLEMARELNVKLVCAHKGLSGLADNGTARDIGPAAKAFPDLNFVVYHSGYEVALADGEGPYTPAVNAGVNTLLKGIEDAGVERQGNIFAELGTTWFCLIRRPREAAHVWGKLLKMLGEDNVVWGSDSIWYGSPQPTIDAFRAFQIPDDMCKEFGYSKITPEIKAKILGINASKVYNIDIDAARTNFMNDDLSWARKAILDYKNDGFGKLY
jgi:predicted TIM-barrel fold metal-dependent hydrolase